MKGYDKIISLNDFVMEMINILQTASTIKI